MKVTQFVMAYGVDQDRVRAMMPEGYESLRPVLRINAEIRTVAENAEYYLEFNVPVASQGKRGWLNIANWSSLNSRLECCSEQSGNVTFSSPFVEITFSPVGITGGCPAEKDNDGCFHKGRFVPAEIINEKKEFCHCTFRWKFHDGDACGESTGETIPAYIQEVRRTYEKCEMTAENAAAIPCTKVLGSYMVEFRRDSE